MSWEVGVKSARVPDEEKLQPKYSSDSDVQKTGRLTRAWVNVRPSVLVDDADGLPLSFMGLGLAKRNPSDTDDPVIGQLLALARAHKSVARVMGRAAEDRIRRAAEEREMLDRLFSRTIAPTPDLEDKLRGVVGLTRPVTPFTIKQKISDTEVVRGLRPDKLSNLQIVYPDLSTPDRPPVDPNGVLLLSWDRPNPLQLVLPEATVQFRVMMNGEPAATLVERVRTGSCFIPLGPALEGKYPEDIKTITVRYNVDRGGVRSESGRVRWRRETAQRRYEKYLRRQEAWKERLERHAGGQTEREVEPVVYEGKLMFRLKDLDEPGRRA